MSPSVRIVLAPGVEIADVVRALLGSGLAISSSKADSNVYVIGDSPLPRYRIVAENPTVVIPLGEDYPQ